MNVNKKSLSVKKLQRFFAIGEIFPSNETIARYPHKLLLYFEMDHEIKYQEPQIKDSKFNFESSDLV